MAAGLFDDLVPAEQPATGGVFDDIPAAPGFTPGDYLKGLKRGVLQVPGSLTGLADVPGALLTGERYADKAADKLGDLTGFKPAQWAKETELSPGANASLQQLDSAWKKSGADRLGSALLGNISDLPDAWRQADLGAAGKAIVENPGAAALNVVESIPGMLVGGALGKGLAVVGKVAPVLAGAAGEGLITAGQQLDQTDRSADPRTAAASALAAGAGTGLIAGIGGKAAQRLGLEDVQTAMAGGRADDVGRGMVGRIGGGAAAEAGQEFLQSGQEQGWQNFSENKPLGEGVIRSSVEGAIAGAVMGGGSNLLPARSTGDSAPAYVPRQDGQGLAEIDPAVGPISAAAAEHAHRSQAQTAAEATGDHFGDLAPPPIEAVPAHVGLDLFADLVPADEPVSTLQAWQQQAEPISFEEAQGLVDQAQAAGYDGHAIIRHGDGFGVVPREWLQPSEIDQTLQLGARSPDVAPSIDLAAPRGEPDPLAQNVEGDRTDALPDSVRNALRRFRPSARRALRSAPSPEPVLAVRQAPDVPGLFHVQTHVTTVGERELPVDTVASWDDAAKVFHRLSRHAVERVDGLVTDAEGRPLAVIGGFKGGPTSSSVHPSTLIGELSRIDGAAHLWLAHNHPSGTDELSSADRSLSAMLEKTLAGSGVTYHGLAAVARTGEKVTWQATDHSNGEVPRNLAIRRRVPLVEREIITSNPGAAISSPETAKTVVSSIAQEHPGIVFLTAQNTVAAFVPFDPAEMGELRQGDRLMRLFRAASQSGATAAIAAMPDGKVSATQFSNLKGALGAVEVRLLDGIRYDSKTGETERSLAEEGNDASAGLDFFSRRDSAPRTGATPSAMDSTIYASARAGFKLTEALEVIAEASTTPFYRQLGRLLLEKKVDALVRTAPADGAHGGAYDPRTNTISLLTAQDAERHLLHEAVHSATLAALGTKSLPASQMKALFEHAKAQLSGEHYGLHSIEEFVSEALSSPTFQAELAQLPGKPGLNLRSAWHWFVRNVRQMLGLDKGQESLLEQVLATSVDLMTPVAPNGKASNLTPAQWRQVRTPEFKAWFGDWERAGMRKGDVSRAVDENGEPKVLYHGSKQAGTITAFRPNERGLIWATSERATAESYAGADRDVRAGEDGAGLLPVFLNLRDPIEVDLGGRHYADLPVTDGQDYVDHLAMQARAQGRDGAILRNVIDDGGESSVGDLETPADNYAVFRPEQIKSATENAGTFDPGNADIRYNRLANDAEHLTVRDWISHHLANHRSWALGALTRDQLADIYGKQMPEVEAFDKVVQAMDQARNVIAEKADEVIERWRKLPTKTADALADVMHTATLEQFDPDTKTRDDVNTPEQSILLKDWAALPDEAKQLYRDVRDTYTATLLKLRNGLAKRAERAGRAGERTAAEIRLQFDKYLADGPYFPLARFGDFILIAEKHGERIVEAFESSAAREKRARGLRVQGWTTKLTAKKAFSAASDGPSGEFVGRVMKLVDGLAIDAKEKGALMDDLNQLAIGALPDQSYRRHFAHRKGTPGFSSDAMRAFASSMQHVAHHTARVLHGDELTLLLDGLNKRIRETTGDVDTTAQQQVANELAKRLELMMNPSTHPVTALAGQVGFVMSLGGSVASGITNLSQTPMITFPWLGAKFGFDKAAAALTKASRDYFGGRWDKWSGFVVKDNAKLSADERRALQQLEDAGLINLTQTSDLASTATTDSAASSRSWAVNRAMKIIGWTFSVPEVFNRQVSALAAYRLAREKGQNHEQALETAGQTLRRTHFDYSASNRARWMSGNFVRVVSMFRQYSQQMTYLLWRSAWRALKGESPEVRREARRMLLGVAVTHFGAAGALGLPLGVFGITPLLGLLAMGMGSEDSPWDWETEFRNMLADTFGKQAGEAIAHGPLRLLTNVDFASRVGLGDLWVRAPQGDAEGRDLVEKWMLTLLGPTAGYIGNLGTAAKAFDEGKYGRGLEAMLPKMLSAPLKAIRYETEGVKSWRGDDLGVALDVGDVLATALGFNPAKVAEMYEGRNAIKGRESRLVARREEISNMFTAAALAGDTEMEAAATKAAQAFSLRNPSLALPAQSLHRSLQAKVRSQALIQNGVYLPAKRQDLLAEGRFANVE